MSQQFILGGDLMTEGVADCKVLNPSGLTGMTTEVNSFLHWQKKWRNPKKIRVEVFVKLWCLFEAN